MPGSTWNDTGNLIVDGVFTWLIDGVDIEGKHEPGIGYLIDEDFNMYLFHQREVNGEQIVGGFGSCTTVSPSKSFVKTLESGCCTLHCDPIEISN